jgi:hypothetical protein
MQKIDPDIGFQEKTQLFSRKIGQNRLPKVYSQYI